MKQGGYGVKSVVPVLELDNISKNFGAIQALSHVSLSIEPGQVVGLMGDNGAGKSTLVKIMAGNYPPSEGSIRVEGDAVRFNRPVEARHHGIEVVYQDLALCNNLTAAANVFLGRELKKGIGPFRVLDFGPIQATAETQKTIPLPPVVGGLALVGGIVVLAIGARRSAAL